MLSTELHTAAEQGPRPEQRLGHDKDGEEWVAHPFSGGFFSRLFQVARINGVQVSSSSQCDSTRSLPCQSRISFPCCQTLTNDCQCGAASLLEFLC